MVLINQSFVSDEERKDGMTTENTKINNGSISFLSEMLINQSFVSDKERKDDTRAENIKQKN